MNLARIGDVSLTTVEIAEMTGKRHDHIMTDTKKMLIELHSKIDLPRFGEIYLDTYGREQTSYRLPRREVLILTSGYSISLRAAIIDRMNELEGVSRLRDTSTDIFEIELRRYKLVNTPVHIAQIEAVKQVKMKTDEDLSYLLDVAPAQNNIKEEDVMLEPRELGKHFGLKAQGMNKMLASLGLQIKIRGGEWMTTVKGDRISSRHAWSKGYKSGYNYKWSLQAVRSLAEDI